VPELDCTGRAIAKRIVKLGLLWRQRYPYPAVKAEGMYARKRHPCDVFDRGYLFSPVNTALF
jgi:hypothetical protein